MTHESYREIADALAEPARELRAMAPDAWAGFGALHRAVVAEGVLPARVKELMALVVAVVKQCDGCIAYHAKAAARRGASPEEVAEALSVALLMDGGTASVYGPRAWQAYRELSGLPVPRERQAEPEHRVAGALAHVASDGPLLRAAVHHQLEVDLVGLPAGEARAELGVECLAHRPGTVQASTGSPGTPASAASVARWWSGWPVTPPSLNVRSRSAATPGCSRRRGRRRCRAAAGSRSGRRRRTGPASAWPCARSGRGVTSGQSIAALRRVTGQPAARAGEAGGRAPRWA
ncbi:MAG: carboxymuconolactone decarboxylase family protein [Acidimicrobiales bacterium]